MPILAAAFLAGAAVVATLASSPSRCGAADADSTSSSKLVKLVRPLVKPGDGSWIVLPKVTHSTETSWGFGAEVGKAFEWGEGATAINSAVRLEGRYTLEGQGEASGELVLGWLDRKYTFKTKASFSNIPYRFYGIGPDTPIENEEVYQRQSLLCYIEGFRRITAHLRVGLRGELETSRMLEMEPGGALNSGAVPGTENEGILGGGLLVSYDTRDHPLVPRRGSYHQAFLLTFRPTGTQDRDFSVLNIDLRWYFPVRSRDVLAVQAFTYGNHEEPPFWRLAAVGGRGHSRGYRRGRYVNQVMAAGQLEYRFVLRGSLFGSVFGGVAEAVPDLRETALSYWHPTVGGGLRIDFGFVHVRGDLAYGNEMRGYLSIGEAF